MNIIGHLRQFATDPALISPEAGISETYMDTWQSVLSTTRLSRIFTLQLVAGQATYSGVSHDSHTSWFYCSGLCLSLSGIEKCYPKIYQYLKLPVLLNETTLYQIKSSLLFQISLGYEDDIHLVKRLLSDPYDPRWDTNFNVQENLGIFLAGWVGQIPISKKNSLKCF